MKPHIRSLLLIVLVLGLAALGCRAPASVTPTVDLAATHVVETALAQVPPTQAPPPSEAPAPPPVTPPPVPPTDPGPSPTPGTGGCTDRVGFVTDVTYPDDTEVASGAAFTKTWRFVNTGTCTWTSSYALVFDHGDQMGGAASIPLAGVVPPGSTVDLSVNLTAPSSSGTYEGFWMLRNNSGVLFGLGASGNVAFWVRIVVPEADSPLMPFEPGLIITPMHFMHAAFTASFANVHTCSSHPYATFRLENTGDFTFESSEPRLYNLTTGGTLYGTGYSNSPFTANASACPAGASSLAPGAVAYTAMINGGSGASSGDQGRLSIRLCTEDGLGGTCVTREVNFTFP
jgi:hypothetical protein